MIKIKARNLLKLSTQELWGKLAGMFILTFDDGEVITNDRETVYSSYVWDMHRQYPDTPLLVKHHLQTLTSKKRLGTDTHLKLLNAALWSVYDTYVHSVPDKTQLLDTLAKRVYEISNEMYNDLSYRLEEYVTSLDITDFVNVTTHPTLVKAMDESPNTQDGIDGVYKTIQNLFKTEPSFQMNPLVKAINSGLANKGQALQCVGPRGFLTDIDSNIFRTPIKRGFTHGIRSMYDFSIETRSAAKSLIYSTEPLQQSEYFSRRQQLVCMNVRHLHTGDCGSEKYLSWLVRDARFSNESAEESADINDQFDENGEEANKVANRYQSDLTTIAGKYYLDEATNTLKVVHVTDTHLYGKTIKMRSPIAGCNHPDPYGICEVCYGETALAIPANSNLGHITCVSMTGVLGQNILSTKHFDGSSVVEGIVLDQFQKKYLNAPVNGNSYFLNDTIKKSKKVKFVFRAKDATGLTDIELVSNISKLSLARVSEFETVGLHITDRQDNTEEVSLDVHINNRLSSMSYDMLDYVRSKKWEVVNNDFYSVDMSEWDYKKPILVLPLRHFNMNLHQSIGNFNVYKCFYSFVC